MSFTYCPLFSGSSGNSAFLSTPNTSFLIDAGLPGKSIINALESIQVDPRTLEGIIITHEHSDHIRGAGILSRKYNLPIYANANTWSAMAPALGSIAPQNIRIFATNHDFFIGDCQIFPFAIPHDAAEPVGFTFFHQGKKIAQATDLGHTPAALFNFLENSDIILLESNHDIQLLKQSARPAVLKKRILSNTGHLSNNHAAETCLRLATEHGCRRFILGHMSGEANTAKVAWDTTKQHLELHGLELQKDVDLFLAYRDRPCAVFRI